MRWSAAIAHNVPPHMSNRCLERAHVRNSVAIATAENRCGVNWADADGKCGAKCPGAVDSECPSGETCFGQLDACGPPTPGSGMIIHSTCPSHVRCCLSGLPGPMCDGLYVRVHGPGCKSTCGTISENHHQQQHTQRHSSRQAGTKRHYKLIACVWFPALCVTHCCLPRFLSPACAATLSFTSTPLLRSVRHEHAAV